MLRPATTWPDTSDVSEHAFRTSAVPGPTPSRTPSTPKLVASPSQRSAGPIGNQSPDRSVITVSPKPHLLGFVGSVEYPDTTNGTAIYAYIGVVCGANGAAVRHGSPRRVVSGIHQLECPVLDASCGKTPPRIPPVVAGRVRSKTPSPWATPGTPTPGIEALVV